MGGHPELVIVSGDKSTLIMRPVLGEYYRIRSDKLRRQQIAKEREEQRKLEDQRYLQRQEEEQKIANLNAQVKNWFESRQIRAYLEALKESFIKLHGQIEPCSKADEYFKWAFGYVDRLDPLVPR